MPSANPGWWFEDACGTRTRLGLLASTLHKSKTRFQQVEVLEHATLGRVLVLDGVVQTTTADEFIYHEMIAHVPILGRPAAAEPGPTSVLIIGGGDGGTLREVLRHAFVSRVVMVEIDGEVIEICKTHLGIQGDFEDPRVELIVGDGAAYAGSAEARSAFDVIVVDSSDPLGGPANPLFGPEFTGDLHACLKPRGVAVRQYGMPFLESTRLGEGVAHTRASFATVQVFRVAVPTYLGGEMAFLLGADGDGCEHPHRPHRGRWYTPEVHTAAFQLPPFWEEKIAGQ